MSNTATASRLDAMRAESAKVQAALDAATRDALLEHARMGRTVPVTGPDGATRQAPPAEIFARYGLDEFGRATATSPPGPPC